MIVGRLRSVVEQRWPLLATIYRQLRGEIHFAREKALPTSEGFFLAGDVSMQTDAFEPEERRILRDLLAETDVFVDIGANVGFYSCLARQMGKRVLAFEPLHSNLRVLYRNLHHNGWDDVEVWPVALAARSGTLPLYGASTGASLVSGWAGVSDTYRTTVPTARLDDILGRRFDDQRMLIKVDVEGAEFGVLQGAAATIGRHPRAIWLVEIMLRMHRPTKNEQFLGTFETLLDQGYSVQTTVAPRRNVTRDELRCWWQSGEMPRSVGYNWLFVPSARTEK